MNSRAIFYGGIVAAMLVSLPCAAAETARAELVDSKGKSAGTVLLTQTPQGVLLSVRVSKLPPGVHALHIHEVGKCEPPFTTAGGHFNPGGKKHGLSNPEGMHAGDLPNLHVSKQGKAEVEVFATGVTLSPGATSLLDDDGSAIVLHAGPDDYATDPAGKAGDRIACGVVRKISPR
ncbi:MAG: superoxide dismutase family protein [Deltaproteobacteria bacterium]|nr:superoxide dismutase family protein [Deltaproteobacteria bacterium]